MDLDLTGLTDDQLVELIRQACRETASRTPVVRLAAEAAIIDESERLTIQREAAAREAAKLRAQERERLANAAAAAVRAAAAANNAVEEARNAEANAKIIAANAAKLAAEATAQRYRLAVWADKWREIIGWERDFCIVIADTRYGRRLLVNADHKPYDHRHLVDWLINTTTIKTSLAHVSQKPEIIKLAAEYAAHNPTLTHLNISAKICPTN